MDIVRELESLQLQDFPVWENIASLFEDDFEEFFGFEAPPCDKIPENEVLKYNLLLNEVKRRATRFRPKDNDIRKMIKRNYRDLYETEGMYAGEIEVYSFGSETITGFDLGRELPKVIIFEDTFSDTFLAVGRYGNYNFVLSREFLHVTGKSFDELNIISANPVGILQTMQDFFNKIV